MRVQTGDNVGIAGFIIRGGVPKKVIIRGLGPSLQSSGISDYLFNPTLALHKPNGDVVYNQDWKDTQEAAVTATGIPPQYDVESAIVDTLDPGSYTVILRGLNDGVGLGLIEVYDLDTASAELANISTRAFCGMDSDIVIAGFMLGGKGGGIDRVIVRGLGPSLGVSNALADPTLELRNSSGALLVANDDWQDDPDQAAELTGAGLAPTNNLESAIAATLPPGSYTALLKGVKRKDVGVALVEVYDLGAPPPSGINGIVYQVQAGSTNAIEKQHVHFDQLTFTGTFRIRVYKPSAINNSYIGARAALQGETDPISFTASAAEIVAAIEAVPKSYYAYGQFGNLELNAGDFRYFASQGAINRDPKVIMDSGAATAGFRIEFGSLVGSPPRYNTWVSGMPLITISVP
ncbi:MAG: hypothetical protein DLM73_04515 [Chthoniobacterales bacterium]|nr:MAG: hypothetical protein DLM73_04515 [Chthoniobacterales bacterium]